MVADRSGGAVQFREVQAYAVWVYGLFAAIGAVVAGLFLTLASPQKWILLCVTVPLLLGTANMMRMETVVDEESVTVRFGWLFGAYRRRIPRVEIALTRPVRYSPLGEYGGWGVRGTMDDSALTARGDRGVRLLLKGGGRVLIGSQQPEALAAALAPERERVASFAPLPPSNGGF